MKWTNETAINQMRKLESEELGNRIAVKAGTLTLRSCSAMDYLNNHTAYRVTLKKEAK
jgi:hypothetical protein